MSAPDFAAILGKQAAEIEQPKALPVGNYIFSNPNMPEFPEKGIGKNNTPAANFNLVVIQPLDDVDQAALSEFGDYAGKKLRYTAWLSEASLFYTLESLCRAFGIEQGDKTVGQIFQETVGRTCAGTVTHRPSDDGTRMFAQISEITAA